MNRPISSSHSPSSYLPSPRTSREIQVSSATVLPLIKGKSITTTGNRFFVQQGDQKPEEKSLRPSTRSINFLSIPTPVDEKKLGIVKSLLDRKSTLPVRENEIKKSAEETVITENSELPQKFDSEGTRSNNFEKILNSGILDLSKDPSIILDTLKKGNSYSNIDTSSGIFRSNQESNLSLTDLINGEHNTEIMNSLKQELNNSQKTNKVHTQNQTRLKLQYETEIDQLTKENYYLEKNLENAGEKIRNLEAMKKGYVEELAEAKTKCQEALCNSANAMNGLKNELAERLQEVLQLQESLKRSENIRRKYCESVKDMEVENNMLKKQNATLEKSYENLAKENKNLSKEQSAAKLENLKISGLSKELEAVHNDNNALQAKCNKMEGTVREMQGIIDELRKEYDKNRFSWREKESAYENLLQELAEELSAEKEAKNVKITELKKIKKVLTLRDTDSVSNFSKEELSRYQQKVLKQEKSNIDSSIEIQKLNKSINHYKNLLQHQSVIISRLESQVSTDTSRSEGPLFSSLERIIINLKDSLWCQKCKTNQSAILFFPCKHCGCAQCQSSQNTCPICGSAVTSRIAWRIHAKVQEAIQVLESFNI